MCKICNKDISYQEVSNAQSIYDCLGIGALNEKQIEYLLSNGTKEAKDFISSLILFGRNK